MLIWCPPNCRKQIFLFFTFSPDFSSVPDSDNYFNKTMRNPRGRNHEMARLMVRMFKFNLPGFPSFWCVKIFSHRTTEYRIH
jgi:hypothetical protein